MTNTIKKFESVGTQEENFNHFERIRKHWKNCLGKPNKIFSDLKGFLKMNSIWFAAFIKIMKNRKATIKGVDDKSSLTKLEILEIKKRVLNGN